MFFPLGALTCGSLGDTLALHRKLSSGAEDRAKKD
jgi:hypothetical protein